MGQALSTIGTGLQQLNTRAACLGHTRVRLLHSPAPNRAIAEVQGTRVGLKTESAQGTSPGICNCVFDHGFSGTSITWLQKIKGLPFDEGKLLYLDRFWVEPNVEQTHFRGLQCYIDGKTNGKRRRASKAREYIHSFSPLLVV